MAKKNELRTSRKRLFFDIETSPNICLVFQTGFKKTIGPDSIIKERAIICICYKWEDDKNVNYLTWDKNQSDKLMLTKFLTIANSADELVGHNSDKFDIAYVRTRCLFHGITMMPNIVSIDTLKISRSKFNFNSNKLDYIAKFLGMGGKIKTDFSLWKNILLDKDKIAMQKMVKYCQKDVVLLEKVFKQLNNHIEAKTHYGVIFGQDRGSCPECGSDDLMKIGTRRTATGLAKQVYECKTCKKYHRKTIK